MSIVIKKDYNEMSRYAADMVAGFIRAKPDCVLGLATGSTPVGMYRELIRMHREGLDFTRVRTFNLDEYLGLGINLSKPYEMDQSYARFMYEELFRHIGIPSKNTHVPDGLAKEPARYCEWYESEIRKAGGIDIQVLGLGRDGHWGFNEPGSSLASRTRVQALNKETLDDNYESFYRKTGATRDEMPKFAITMGIGTILEARNAIMLVSGEKKADILAKAIEGPVTSQVTASALQLYSGGLTVVLDTGAASKLKNLEHYMHVQKLEEGSGSQHS